MNLKTSTSSRIAALSLLTLVCAKPSHAIDTLSNPDLLANRGNFHHTMTNVLFPPIETEPQPLPEDSSKPKAGPEIWFRRYNEGEDALSSSLPEEEPPTPKNRQKRKRSKGDRSAKTDIFTDRVHI